MTRFFFLSFTTVALLTPGLVQAEDESTRWSDASAIHYYHCTVSGGEEVMDDRNGVRQCWLSDFEYIACSVDYSECGLYVVFAYPGPDPRAPAGSSAATATEAPAGPADSTAQPQIQR